MIEHGNRWKFHHGLYGHLLDMVICQSGGQLRSTSLSVLTYSKVSDKTNTQFLKECQHKKTTKCMVSNRIVYSDKYKGLISGITRGWTTVKNLSSYRM